MKHDRILLGHGGGGSLTRELITGIFAAEFDNPVLKPLEDSAVLVMSGKGYAFTTDSYVVKPYFFPGGDIGKLAVCGTVNDLAMQGAQPYWLSLSFILEEGLPLAALHKIVQSIGHTARSVGVEIVAGDTKVVERGKCEGLYINAAGLGRIQTTNWWGAGTVKTGDAVLLNGFLAEHGIAVLSQREGIAFTTRVVSDCAPLWPLVKAILDTGAEIHAMRDLTRGGLAAAVCDIAQAAKVGIHLDETTLPVDKEVRGACDLLGLDPLSIANEGKCIVFCPVAESERVLAATKQHPLGKEARIIGKVSSGPEGMAVMRTAIGGERIIDMPTGEDLPRIC
jgi:hydrogenase expression/formation protein HypE